MDKEAWTLLASVITAIATSAGAVFAALVWRSKLYGEPPILDIRQSWTTGNLDETEFTINVTNRRTYRLIVMTLSAPRFAQLRFRKGEVGKKPAENPGRPEVILGASIEPGESKDFHVVVATEGRAAINKKVSFKLKLGRRAETKRWKAYWFKRQIKLPTEHSEDLVNHPSCRSSGS